MIKFTILALVGISVAKPITETEFQFFEYLSRFGKSYGTIEEFQLRLE